MKKPTPRQRRRKRPPELPPEIDPTFPLPAHTEIPQVHQSDGEAILNDTRMMIVELPYRAFYMMWEYAERRGEKIYPQYINRTDHMQPVAQAALEAVHAFRSSFRGEILPIMEEEAARKARLERTQILAEEQAKKKPAKPSGNAARDEVEAKLADSPMSAVKRLCSSVLESDDGLVQCRGPEGHKRKLHKGERDGYVYEWED